VSGGFGRARDKRFNEKGFTLIEVLAVIVMIGILASIAALSVGHLINKAEADVCYVNRTEIGRLYQHYLVLDVLEHSDVLFVAFSGGFDNTFPIGGSYRFVDGEVVCDLNSELESEEEDQDDNGVPCL